MVVSMDWPAVQGASDPYPGHKQDDLGTLETANASSQVPSRHASHAEVCLQQLGIQCSV